MKILLIGNGSIGEKTLFNLKTLGYEDVDTCDPKGGTFYNLKDIKDLGKYKLCLICTPPETHLDLLHILNSRGVPYIMCEKPLFIDPIVHFPKPVCRELASQVFVNNAYRFERGIIKLKELISEGTIGKISHVSMENSYSFKKLHPTYRWEDYCGILYDDLHIINTSRFLFGEPTKVLSKMIRRDICQFNWETAMGLISHMTDVLSPRYKKRIEVRGENGVLIYNFRAHEIFLSPADESERIAIPYKHCDHLSESLKYVLRVVEAGENFEENTIDDACRDMQIVEELKNG